MGVDAKCALFPGMPACLCCLIFYVLCVFHWFGVALVFVTSAIVFVSMGDPFASHVSRIQSDVVSIKL